MHFGALLKQFRQERHLTLRDLGTLSEVDHAYIYRLETGEKSSPSAETLTALTTALKLDSRKRCMLRLLAVQEAPSSLVALVLDDPGQHLADFMTLATMCQHRTVRKTREEWSKLLTLACALREEFERQGR